MLASEPAMCSAAAARWSSGVAVATESSLLERVGEFLAQRPDFVDPPETGGQGQGSPPAFPQTPDPNYIRDEFSSPPVQAPPPSPSTEVNTASSSSSDEAPIYAFYINGINTVTSAYESDKVMVEGVIQEAGISLAMSMPTTYNVSGKEKWILSLGDLNQAAIQSMSNTNTDEGRAFTASVVNLITQKDNEEKGKKGNCGKRAKFLIVAHSQGNFFAEDIINQLRGKEGGIPTRTKVLAISPFTSYSGISGVTLLVRGDDMSRRAQIFPNVGEPQGRHQAKLPGISPLVSHSIRNYLDPDQARPRFRRHVRTTRAYAVSQIQEMMDFDSGLYGGEGFDSSGCTENTVEARLLTPETPTTTEQSVATQGDGICRVPLGFWQFHRRQIATVALEEGYCIVEGRVATGSTRVEGAGGDGFADGIEFCGVCERTGNNTFGQPPTLARCSQPEDPARTNPVPFCPSNWSTGGEYKPGAEDVFENILEEEVLPLLPNIF